jgi:hypothetical protein
MSPRTLRFFPAALVVLSILSLPAAARDSGATLTYRKVFKSSFPEFVEIKVNENGSGTFDIRQLDEEANPEPFEVSRPIAEKMFALAAQLHHFQNLDLDIHRRIANLGAKTFRWEKDGEAHEVTFNYTLDGAATQLLSIFDGLGREELDLNTLERTMRYDRLGVNEALLRIESDWNNKILPEPERLLPALDRLAADEKFIDLARARARTLAQHIRNSP